MAQHPGGSALVPDERAPPHRALEDLAVVGGPLGLGAQGRDVVGQRRAELHPGRRDAAGDVEDAVPARGDLLEPKDAAGPAAGVGDPGGAAGGVEPRAGAGAQRVGGELDVLRSTGAGPGVRPRAEVGVGDGGGRRVGVDGGDGHPERAHRHRVRTDAAPEVVDGRQARGGEAPGVPGRDLEPAGLLQPVGGEEHPVGELAELRSGPGAQSQLGEEGSRPRGVEPVGAQPSGRGQRGGLVVGRQVREECARLRAGEPAHDLGVHARILPRARNRDVLGAARRWHSG